MQLKPSHPSVVKGLTIHPKRVFNVSDYRHNVLKSAKGNSKLGKGLTSIVKGKWKGFPLFTLTLEERATCPTSCHHWLDCYGNSMGFAHRFKPSKELEVRLDFELGNLAKKYVKGFAVRLHVLGDFYSTGYVDFWWQMLLKYPNLHLYGYTARDSKDEIGKRLDFVRMLYPERFWIRQSVSQKSEKSFVATSVLFGGSITCPEQVGKTESCLTCGLCWSVKNPIHFITHKRKPRKKGLTSSETLA